MNFCQARNCTNTLLFIATSTVANLLLFANMSEAQAIPLQVGTYSLDASSHIEIAAKGERFCYAGSFKNGATIASLHLYSKIPGYYLVNNSALGISQQDVDTILWGPGGQMIPVKRDREMRSGTGFSNDLQKCLNSNKPFYKQYKPSGRQSR
ncbi:MAG: hypothetical protein U7123_13620 [Potamolinea sp.]